MKDLTLKKYTVLTRDKITDKLVSINILEFVTEITNYSTLLVALSFNIAILNTNFPVVLNWTNNSTTKCWMIKAATKFEKAQSLQRIICYFMINSLLGYNDNGLQGG